MRLTRLLGLGALLGGLTSGAAEWDPFSDTWSATDGLGRPVAGFAETGPPRADRQVGMFYFLWHGPHIQGGPYDISRILAANPEAMQDPSDPRWGPLHAPHHWGESLFGYYLSEDEGVLRKHAQMLANAGIDVVIFDVTNQLTYPESYGALLRVWSEVRGQGNPTPQVAFLAPFWEPAKVVRELWRDLYSTGRHADLWYRWEGRPLILADPERLEIHRDRAEGTVPIELAPGHALGQEFERDAPFRGVGGRFATWHATDSAVTLTLRRDGPGGERLLAQRFHAVEDNAWLMLRAEAMLPPGRYFLEASEAGGRVGWWTHREDFHGPGTATVDGGKVEGDRTLRWSGADPEVEEIRRFFTWRAPQPDYFRGPTRSNMWSWLEVYPQHVFRNDRGEKEQMSVGVAQNAVNGRLGAMSEAGALGRSVHGGARDLGADAVRRGLNVAEQWARARAEDPRFVFVTGWNEWIAGRFAEFNGVRLPVMFVDQFDQEHSRDIEPMKGGHGDDYYYQLVSEVRRYKGARPVPPVVPAPIRIDGQFADWEGVQPEFRDTLGDPVRRRHRGWDPQVTYEDHSGRNDLRLARISAGRREVFFYLLLSGPAAEADARSGEGPELLLDTDGRADTGWLGFDLRVRPTSDPRTAELQRHSGGMGWNWEGVRQVRQAVKGGERELAIPWRDLGWRTPPAVLEFKWIDHCIVSGEWSDLTLRGDAAPNDRFRYRAVFRPERP